MGSRGGQLLFSHREALFGLAHQGGRGRGFHPVDPRRQQRDFSRREGRAVQRHPRRQLTPNNSEQRALRAPTDFDGRTKAFAARHDRFRRGHVEAAATGFEQRLHLPVEVYRRVGRADPGKGRPRGVGAGARPGEVACDVLDAGPGGGQKSGAHLGPQIGIVAVHGQGDGPDGGNARTESRGRGRGEWPGSIGILFVSFVKERGIGVDGRLEKGSGGVGEVRPRGCVEDAGEAVFREVGLAGDAVEPDIVGLEEGPEAVVVLLRERMVFMIVAASAFEG